MISHSYEHAPVQGLSAALRAEFLGVVPPMRALARCLCADVPDAEALAHESVKQALARRDERAAAASLLNWCFGVELEVFHSRAWRAISPHTSKRRTASPFRRTLRWRAPTRNAEAPDALADLAIEEREVVVLVDAARRTVEETAAICKSTPEAIGRLLDQARARLRRMMAVEDAA